MYLNYKASFLKIDWLICLHISIPIFVCDCAALNILQVGHTLKLIDLDGAACYSKGALAGSKISSAYVPPEMLLLQADGKVSVRSESARTEDRIPADPSQDMWSLGCVLYLLFTGSTLFQCTVDENMSVEDDLYVLYQWTESYKKKRLSVVTDRLARNMLSVLLMRDPSRRMSPRRALHHPFITGRHATRLVGEDATWDVFISYRVDSDVEHAELLYSALCREGLKVWWDKKCLLPGQNWEEGFCNGLVDSTCFVCLLSRDAIKNESRPWHNFEILTDSSKCDNVLLEWRLALELYSRGMLSSIFPILIGDKEPDGKYSNYITSGCNPTAPDVCVESVELKLREHIDREGLGTTYNDSMTIKSTLQQILSFAGVMVVGRWEERIDIALKFIKGCVKSRVVTGSAQANDILVSQLKAIASGGSNVDNMFDQLELLMKSVD